MAHTKRKKIIGIAVGLITLLIACLVLVLIPVRHYMDNQRFNQLSEDMKAIYNQIESKDSQTKWNYKQSCHDLYSGDLPNGTISCSVEIQSHQSISDISVFNTFQVTYYPLVDTNPLFLPTTPLNEEPRNGFGKNFVVTGADQYYRMTDIAGVACHYDLALGQANETGTNFVFGSVIETPQATLELDFICSGSALDYWYQKD